MSAEGYDWNTVIEKPRESRPPTPASNAKIIDLYRGALSDTPPAGAGLRHDHCFAVALLARKAGITQDDAAHDWQAACPGRGRAYREMAEAWRNVRDVDTTPTRGYRPLTQPKKMDCGAFWRAAIAAHPDPVAELWESSPIRLLDDPEADTALFLRKMYDGDDVLFIGEKFDTDTIRTREQWIDARTPAQFICANPLSGEVANTQTGKLSRRCDAAVSAYRYAVIEFDNLPKEHQAAFFLHAKLPLAAVVDSGGKSLHGWIHVNTDRDGWHRDVKPVFRRLLGPLGADRALSNASRLVRLPGAVRDNGNRQSLMYLAGRVAV